VKLWEIAAREQVRDTLARYTHAADRGRSADVADCFTAEGVLDVGREGGRWAGREQIIAELDAVAARLAEKGDTPGLVRHHVSSVVIEFPLPTEASVRSYFFVVTSIGPDHWGRYLDRLEPDGDRWRFTERRAQVDGHAAGSRMVSRS
jgi:hypothetical protein